MKKLILILMAAVLFASCAYCASASGIKFKASPVTMQAEEGETFYINIRLVNETRDVKVIEVKGDGTDWETDNDAVKPQIVVEPPEVNPVLKKITLGAYATYEEMIPVSVEGTTGQVTFKMRFKPLKMISDSFTVDIIPSAKTIGAPKKGK